MKRIRLVAFAAIAMSNMASSQNGLTLPKMNDDLIQTEHPESARPEGWATKPPAPGKIRLLAEILLQEAKDAVEAEKTSVPDGATGKGSVLYAKITQWLQQVSLVLQNKTRASLLELNPLHAEILSLSQSGENISIPVLNMVGRIQVTAKALIYNAADFYRENPNLTILEHDKILSMFSEPLFVEMPDWEDEPLPVDRAGTFIMNHDNATAKLKAMTLERIGTFLGGDADNSFFERYEAAGDGMDILKTKYAANKVAIQAKFAEVLAYADQLENQ